MRAVQSVRTLHQSSDPESCGYDEAWAAPEENEGIQCPICMLVPREAVAHSCGELFCQSCWIKCQRQDHRCSLCRQDGDAAPAHRERRKILNMQIQCPQGCDVTVRLGDKQHHLETECCHRPIPCPSCQSKVTPATLEAHTRESCPYRRVPCSKCGVKTTAARLDEHCRSRCPQRTVKCALCQEEVRFSDMEAHFEASPGKHIAALLQENQALRMEVQRLHEQLQPGSAKHRSENNNDEGRMELAERAWHANQRRLGLSGGRTASQPPP